MKLLTGFLLLSSCTVHAGVVYSFSGSYGYFSDLTRLIPASFTLTLPDLVSVDSTFFVGPNLSCQTCSEIQFIADAAAHGFTSTPSSAFLFWPDPTGNYVFYFAPGAFESLGTHASILVPVNSGILTVSATPEPSGFVPILTLLCGAYFEARRSRRR